MPERSPWRRTVAAKPAGTWLFSLVSLLLASFAFGQGGYYWQPEIWHGNRRITPEQTVPAHTEQEVVARQIIAEAQQRVRMHDFEGALKLARIANQLRVSWQPNEETPQSLMQFLDSIPADVWQAAKSGQLDQPVTETPAPDSIAPEEEAPEVDQPRPLNMLRVPAPSAVPVDPTTDQLESRPHREREISPPAPSAIQPTGSPAGLSYQQAADLLRSQARETTSADASMGALSSFALGILFALGLLIVLALFLLRGVANRDGAIFRVELVNTGGPFIQQAMPYPGYGPPPPAVNSVGQVAASEEDLDADDDDGPVILPFPDMGPTFDERKKEEEEQRQRREQAMLQHIFEQNLELREQLLELQPAA